MNSLECFTKKNTAGDASLINAERKEGNGCVFGTGGNSQISTRQALVADIAFPHLLSRRLWSPGVGDIGKLPDIVARTAFPWELIHHSGADAHRHDWRFHRDHVNDMVLAKNPVVHEWPRLACIGKGRAGHEIQITRARVSFEESAVELLVLIK